jgi:mono/diheme cytochrome c family protein
MTRYKKRRARFGGVRLAMGALASMAGLGLAAETSAARGAQRTDYRAAIGDSLAPAVQGADSITPAMIALGKNIFQGKAAGAICFTCHGTDAKGVPGLGPNLTDATWLHGDGSMTFLTTIIRTGVAKPKQSAAVMPPFGGTALNAEQLRAVAAYVYSLSHKTGG